MCSHLGVVHEEFDAVEDIVALLLAGLHLYRLRAPAVVRLGDRHTEHLVDPCYARQDGVALCFGTAMQHDEGAQHTGGKKRPRHRTTSKFLEEHRRIGVRTILATVLFGNQDT